MTRGFEWDIRTLLLELRPSKCHKLESSTGCWKSYSTVMVSLETWERSRFASPKLVCNSDSSDVRSECIGSVRTSELSNSSFQSNWMCPRTIRCSILITESLFICSFIIIAVSCLTPRSRWKYHFLRGSYIKSDFGGEYRAARKRDIVPQHAKEERGRRAEARAGDK